MRHLYTLFLCLLPGLAQAGAWPRAEGSQFVALGFSFSERGNGDADGYQSLYFEYGWTPKLTFGAKVWKRQDGGYGDALVFARYPLGTSDPEHKYAVDLALGVRHYDTGETRPVLQSGFSWGKGVETPLGHGWMGLEAVYGQVIGNDDHWFKADLTLGLSRDDNLLILQLRHHKDHIGEVTALASSYVHKVHDRLKLEIGMTYRLSGSRRAGLLAGTWVEF